RPVPVDTAALRTLEETCAKLSEQVADLRADVTRLQTERKEPSTTDAGTSRGEFPVALTLVTVRAGWIAYTSALGSGACLRMQLEVENSSRSDSNELDLKIQVMHDGVVRGEEDRQLLPISERSRRTLEITYLHLTEDKPQRGWTYAVFFLDNKTGTYKRWKEGV